MRAPPALLTLPEPLPLPPWPAAAPVMLLPRLRLSEEEGQSVHV